MRRRRGRRRMAKRMVRIEKAIVQTAMVPVVIFADRRISRSLKRSA